MKKLQTFGCGLVANLSTNETSAQHARYPHTTPMTEIEIPDEKKYVKNFPLEPNNWHAAPARMGGLLRRGCRPQKQVLFSKGRATISLADCLKPARLARALCDRGIEAKNRVRFRRKAPEDRQCERARFFLVVRAARSGR